MPGLSPVTVVLPVLTTVNAFTVRHRPRSARCTVARCRWAAVTWTVSRRLPPVTSTWGSTATRTPAELEPRWVALPRNLAVTMLPEPMLSWRLARPSLTVTGAHRGEDGAVFLATQSSAGPDTRRPDALTAAVAVTTAPGRTTVLLTAALVVVATGFTGTGVLVVGAGRGARAARGWMSPWPK